MKLAQRVLAIVLVVVAHMFLLSLGNPASVALGIAYGASAIVLWVAAFRLWMSTLD